jgi:hypothetical protein
VFADAMYLRGPNRHATQHLAALVHARARRIRLREAFKNLNPNLLREWTFDLAHAIPEPDDFALLLDIHWSPPKMINENITGTILQARTPVGAGAIEVAKAAGNPRQDESRAHRFKLDAIERAYELFAHSKTEC